VPDSAYMLATVCARQGTPPIKLAFVHPEAVAGMIVSDAEMVRRAKPEAYESALGSGMTAVLLADGTGLETFRGPIIGKEIAAMLLRYQVPVSMSYSSSGIFACNSASDVQQHPT
jgi:hypothetical protein